MDRFPYILMTLLFRSHPIRHSSNIISHQKSRNTSKKDKRWDVIRVNQEKKSSFLNQIATGSSIPKIPSSNRHPQIQPQARHQDTSFSRRDSRHRWGRRDNNWTPQEQEDDDDDQNPDRHQGTRDRSNYKTKWRGIREKKERAEEGRRRNRLPSRPLHPCTQFSGMETGREIWGAERGRWSLAWKRRQEKTKKYIRRRRGGHRNWLSIRRLSTRRLK